MKHIGKQSSIACGYMVDTLAGHLDDDIKAQTERSVLCVDMDHAFLKASSLQESLLRAVRVSPTDTMRALALLTQGWGAFKRRLHEIAPLDATLLPFNHGLLSHLEDERASGRRLALVSSADQDMVEAVAGGRQMFEVAIGRNGIDHLSEDNKLAEIRRRFGDNFSYAGSSAADLPIWRAARSAILVGDGVHLEPKIAPATPVEARFPNSPRAKAWLRAIRPHQWAKNALVFVPFFLAGPLSEPGDFMQSLGGFVVLCLLASAGYIINDLLDLDADRGHPSKRSRPFASGALSVSEGLLGALTLILFSLSGAIALGGDFAVIAMVYFIGTLSYSLMLKRIALLDVMILAGLYTLRIRAGIALVGSVYSYWIITFSMFIFLSLALLKRYAEFVDDRLDEKTIQSRGYSRIDVPLVLGFGIGCSVAAPLLFVIYLVEERFPEKVYSSPEKLWLVTPVLLLWLMHMWREAVRGRVREDPVIFALKDKVSLALGLCAAVLVAVSW